jgi:MFS family permease
VLKCDVDGSSEGSAVRRKRLRQTTHVLSIDRRFVLVCVARSGDFDDGVFLKDCPSMSSSVSSAPTSARPNSTGPDRDLHRVVWLTLALFLSYLCVAMSLPVTSLYVTTKLGVGNAFAGLAVGVAFVSTIMTRGMAGRIADHRGGKYCTIHGLWIYALAGFVCAAANWSGFSTPLAYGVLIVGRLLLGVGESLALVGLIAWCFGIMGPLRSGRVLALIGMGMYGAFAVGSPIGILLFDRTGFTGVMAACALVPLVGLVMVVPVAAVAVHIGERATFWRIIGRIWEPGAALGLAGVGFAAIGAFMPLLFLHQGWSHAGLGLTCFGAAFVLVRVLFGHMPDRAGGIRVALVSTAVEAVGQYLLWTAVTPGMALAGAFLTGLGCSLMFPAMGIEVVRRIPPHLRGTAMGGLAAFQDLAYGGTGPVTGLLADRFGYSSVFLIGGLAASLGFALVIAIARKDRARTA